MASYGPKTERAGRPANPVPNLDKLLEALMEPVVARRGAGLLTRSDQREPRAKRLITERASKQRRRNCTKPSEGRVHLLRLTRSLERCVS
jgi:hypothetical protein